ncbi:MAG: hypothetical protein KGV51_04740 [Moraxellaceae bacterium]|nr:hypothetical protein [Moraxellaceae bacterium]
MTYEEKIKLAVQMANTRIEASRNANGEIHSFLSITGYPLNKIDKTEIGDDLYEQLVKRMLDFINKLEAS